MNVCIQIRAVVNILQEKLSISFEEAMMLFYHSKTYKTLQQTENALWAEAAEYIALNALHQIYVQCHVKVPTHMLFPHPYQDRPRQFSLRTLPTEATRRKNGTPIWL